MLTAIVFLSIGLVAGSTTQTGRNVGLMIETKAKQVLQSKK